eukprot:TRINITY_DN5322_c0_g1_i4.p1 TRINITY_DN5322_c0_g1~~TRINITY_DN5322_c0_g1_i4.p1  ORF type:complete len:544 (+),score=-75.98 TRINITY_DN5322_c0_g1_i4:177-1808(+)
METFPRSAANHPALTPIGFIERAATVYGDRISVVYGSTTFNWSQTFQRCRLLASSLCGRGLNTGDIVSVVAPNVPAMYEMHFGVPMAGGVLNCINTRLDARAISALLRHCRPKILFADHQFVRQVSDAITLAGLRHCTPLFVITDDSHERLAEAARTEKTYESLLAEGDPEFQMKWPADDWQPIVLNYTSGTTSSPKGVVHSHRGVYCMATDDLILWGMTAELKSVYLWTLPMFHANGWCFPWALAAVGATSVCLRRFDAGTVYDAIAAHGVTHLCGAPVVLSMLANESQRALPVGRVKVLTAGAPPPAAVLHKMESLGFSVMHGYGLTETAGLVVCCTWQDSWNQLPASKRARIKARQGVRGLCLTELDVKDPETMRSVPSDGRSPGEVMLRGPTLMMGYLHNPEATARAFTGGWFRTGDVAVRHPDGYIEIKDRSKDIIISGGENISSVEVESVLYSHPAVVEAAVVARPDPHWGETPCAFVVLSGGADSENWQSEIGSFCRQRLPGFMVPRTVVVVNSIPKTATGKVLKSLLRERVMSTF